MIEAAIALFEFFVLPLVAFFQALRDWGNVTGWW